MQQNIILEACVESLHQAQEAEKNGAHRIELCANLEVGGVTPSFKLIQKVKASLHIPIMVIIRPRGGDFVYNAEELGEMKKVISFCQRIGTQGVVLGVLNEGNEINLAQTSELAAFAYPLEVTFHKAIDAVSNPIAELKKLRSIPNIQRVLTSGTKPTALEGQELIRKMIEVAGADLTILAAGKITNNNLNYIHQQIRGKEYHGRKIVQITEA